MAGPFDIVMRLLGDSRDAVKSFDETTTAAKRTERAIQDVQQTTQRTQGRGGLGSQLGGVQDIAQALGLGDLSTIAGVLMSSGPAAFITAAAAGINSVLDRVTAGRQQRVSQETATAANAADLQKAIEDQINEQLLKTSGSPLERLLGRQLELPGGILGTGTSARQRASAQSKVLRDFVNTYPDYAALLVALGGPYASELNQDLSTVQNAKVFQEAAKKAYGQTNVTINTVVADPNSGLSLKAMVDRANRSNGLSTTFTQPGG